MKNKSVLVVMLLILLLTLTPMALRFESAHANPTVYHVYSGQSIQTAIIGASDGDTIIVHNGTYYEAIDINKALNVTGVDGAGLTFINGSGVALSTAGLVRITATSGNVIFSGFTVSNAGADAGGVRIGVLTRSSLDGPTYTISYNKIYGTNDSSEADDYGFYASYGKENLIFTHNVVTRTGANNIVLECHTGSTEISYNTLDAGVYGTDAIFAMTYNGNDVTKLQNVSYNTFDMGTGGPFDYDHRSTAVSFNTPASSWGLTEAKFTNMVIAGNTINNLKNHRRGIGFWNDGTGDNFQSPIVTGNKITGIAGSNNSYGIDFVGGPTSNAIVTQNTIKNVDQGVYLRTAGCAPGAQIHYNNIAGNKIGLNNTVGSSDVDARFNWWGSATGPTHSSNSGGSGDAITNNVDYSPWLGATFATTPRTYHVNPTGTIQEAIDEASSGDTIIVHSGTYLETLYIKGKSLTIKAASTPVIKGKASFTTNYMGSPWTRFAVIFVVNSTNVVINGFDIEGLGPSQDGVVYVYSSGQIMSCIISGNTVGDMSSVDVEARASDLKITSCTIKNFGRIGVFMANCTGGVDSSTIIGQVYSGENLLNYGIEIENHQGVRGILKIIGNIIYNCDNTYMPEPSWSSAGILIDGWSELTGPLPSSTVNMTCNNIYNNYYGIEVCKNALSFAHYVNIYKNRVYGVISAPDYLNNNATFDARYDWWGNATGPYNPTLNPGGLGNPVSANVNFKPWLLNVKVCPLIHSIVVLPLTVTPTMVVAGQTVSISVTVANQGNYFETLNLVTTFGHFTKNETITDIYPGSNATFNYLWDTTGENLCFHGIYATAYPHTYYEPYDNKLQRSGGVRIVSYIPPPATVKVEPSLVSGCVRGSLEVNVTINNLDAYWDMAGWSIDLYYNKTMLNVTGIRLGVFAKQFGLTFQVFQEINNAEGYVSVAYMWDFTQSRLTPHGSGTLFTVRFSVLNAGQGSLSLTNVWLATFPNATKWCIETSIPIAYTAVNGFVTTKIPMKQDVNADGKVDILDVVTAAVAYASRPGSPNWNPYCDLNGDGRIDILDIVSITRVYGVIDP